MLINKNLKFNFNIFNSNYLLQTMFVTGQVIGLKVNKCEIKYKIL